MPSPSSIPGLRWGLISGEYPPAAGGVADYTAQLAAALAAAGDEVHVWAPAPAAATPGVVVHALPGRFGRRARRQMEAEWSALRPAPQILVQYVPHAFGRKAMNLPFCRWIYRQRQRQPWVMFHEVAYPREPGQTLPHRLLALLTRRMASRLRRAAAQSFVSIPAWATWLDEIAPGHAPSHWLPVPSNLPTEVPPGEVAALRQQCLPADAVVLGSFCGHGNYARRCLRRLLPPLLDAAPERAALLIGPGGPALRDDLLRHSPDLAPRLVAPGFLPASDAAAHIAATDLMIQTYPDGVSGRRGTAMAALALGRALLTHEGRFSEPLWRSSGAVGLGAAAAGPEALADALLPLARATLADPARLQHLQQAGHQLYEDHFALGCTVRALRSRAREARA